MVNALFPLLALMLLAWFWLDSSRAREFANILAQRHCDHRGMQFLDQTVALCRIGLRWTSAGLRIRRMFRFDFSLEGAGRHTGYVLMLGAQFEAIDDGLPRDDATTEASSAPVPSNDPKVVPFRRRDR
jgi:hypothetical protein